MKMREEKVKSLYKHTHENHDNIESMSVSEMEAAISKFYETADFEVTSIDELLDKVKF